MTKSTEERFEAATCDWRGPLLQVTWTTSGSDAVASVAVEWLGVGPARRVQIAGWRLGEKSWRYRSGGSAGNNGAFKATAVVTGGKPPGGLCVVATTDDRIIDSVSPPSSCPIRPRSGTSLEAVIPAASTTETTMRK